MELVSPLVHIWNYGSVNILCVKIRKYEQVGTLLFCLAFEIQMDIVYNGIIKL
jgi:hypothetical protein